jgi:hypothetical protein
LIANDDLRLNDKVLYLDFSMIQQTHERASKCGINQLWRFIVRLENGQVCDFPKVLSVRLKS